MVNQKNDSQSQSPIPAGIHLADRSDRVRIEVTGPDRAKFLHNLTTNEVKRLAAGRGCEAFVTSPQGKTIGYIITLAAEDRILVRSDPGAMDLVMPHFRKYGLFDDVAIEDRTVETFEFHLIGDEVEDTLRNAGLSLPDRGEYDHIAADLGDVAVRVVRESPTGQPGFTLIGDRRDTSVVVDHLRKLAGSEVWTEIEPTAFEALRIEAGTPVFGKDVTEKNLPQEIARDDRAISFVKGCYLGQETVARIDALGHVNQVLKGLVFEPRSACPAAGSSIDSGGKRVGVVTSAAVSPSLGCPVALALIRTSHAAAGTSLRVEGATGDEPITATVSDLPFPRRT